MEGFVSQLAQCLYGKYGDGISSLYMLFPSRRARLFFADSLSRLTDKPLWQPAFPAIDELMESIAGLRAGDQIRLVTELYKVYSKYHNEDFDKFYFWGEMLLADFDTIDKYLIDADMLFANISDIKEIDNRFGCLEEDQRKVISQFWRNFMSRTEFSDEQKRFKSIWDTLSPIYHEFRARLSDQNIAYPGMIHRMAAERIKAGTAPVGDPSTRYVIAGFNALTSCEKELFRHLKREYEVDFFWDYDNYYLRDRNQEAGLFLRENVSGFPQTDILPYDNEGFSREKEIVVVSAPSNSLQCKYVTDFLESIDSPGKETAVVLTDENLLMPVLYSIPASVDTVNITMGYPLRQTLVYSFVERLLELQSKSRARGGQTAFYHAGVSGLLAHPFLRRGLSPELEQLSRDITAQRLIYVPEDRFAVDGIVGRVFMKTDTWQAAAEYLVDVLSMVARQPYDGDDRRERVEFLSVAVENVRKLTNSLENCGIEISMSVYVSLLRRLLQSVRIPFEGEPLQGVQIMGILETRNLDFENVIMLSVNDDTFPGNRAVSSSFIPYNLRFGYGLPTPAHHEGVYAYYFYRLLQRAKRVHLVYCSKSDDKSTGEPSRYIYQLKYETGHRIEERDIALDINLESQQPIRVEKTGDVAVRLKDFLDGGESRISPTSFYAYIECPLKFYFRSVAGLKVKEELTEEVDAPAFGSILHKAMELLYSGFVGGDDPREKIRRLIGSEAVDVAVKRSIDMEYLHGEEVPEADYSGNIMLVSDIVKKYINMCLLPYDSRDGEFRVMELEKKISADFGFDIDGERHRVRFYGLSDRVDRLASGIIRVVDYKTGRRNIEFRGVDALFSENAKDRSSAVLQTLLYALMIERSGDGADIVPTLYYVRYMNDPLYSPFLLDKQSGEPVMSYSVYRDDFERLLAVKLGELFDFARPFEQCADPAPCQYCDYRHICRR